MMGSLSAFLQNSPPSYASLRVACSSLKSELSIVHKETPHSFFTLLPIRLLSTMNLDIAFHRHLHQLNCSAIRCVSVANSKTRAFIGSASEVHVILFDIAVLLSSNKIWPFACLRLNFDSTETSRVHVWGKLPSLVFWDSCSPFSVKYIYARVGHIQNLVYAAQVGYTLISGSQVGLKTRYVNEVLRAFFDDDVADDVEHQHNLLRRRGHFGGLDTLADFDAVHGITAPSSWYRAAVVVDLLSLVSPSARTQQVIFNLAELCWIEIQDTSVMYNPRGLADYWIPRDCSHLCETAHDLILCNLCLQRYPISFPEQSIQNMFRMLVSPAVSHCRSVAVVDRMLKLLQETIMVHRYNVNQALSALYTRRVQVFRSIWLQIKKKKKGSRVRGPFTY